MRAKIFCLATLWLGVLNLVHADENPFQESQIIGGLANLSGELFDVDHDGDLDVYLSNYVGQHQVWFNDGQGFFSPGEVFGLSFSNSLTVADFNGDSFLDVFHPSNGVPTSLWLNDGKGRFADSGQTMGNTAGQIGAGDFDADGDVDLFLGWKSPIEDSVAFNDGNGFFQFPNGVASSSGHPLAIGDLDSDGDLDAFVARGGLTIPLGDLVMLNDGRGLFQIQDPNGLGSSFATDVVLIDIDQDSDLDAIVSNISHDGSAPADLIWINDGNANFVDSGQRLGSEDSYDLAVGDVDADGDVDILVSSTDRKQRLWINDGTGTFADAIVISEITDVSDVLIGDIDGDGDADAVMVAFESSRVLVNNTIGAPGDINRDGAVDLLDVAPFVALLADGGYQFEADINSDGLVNLLDVGPLVDLLVP